MTEADGSFQAVRSGKPAEQPADAPLRHLAIIMDGNHRWAKRRLMPAAAGHRAGAKNLRPVAEACADTGIEILTLFAFSTENWQRPRREVDLLMDLMRNLLTDDIEELGERGVRLRIIGDRSRFAPDLQMLMQRAEGITRDNTRLTLCIAVNYGGRWDIADAARRLAIEVEAGRLTSDQIDEDRFAQYLALSDVPAPDMCIRTGGDRRVSNFLLWDFAYTEFYFTDSYWPDFDEQALKSALDEFAQRNRRFGRRS